MALQITDANYKELLASDKLVVIGRNGAVHVAVSPQPLKNWPPNSKTRRL